MWGRMRWHDERRNNWLVLRKGEEVRIQMRKFDGKIYGICVELESKGTAKMEMEESHMPDRGTSSPYLR
jgi:predicted DNA-binding antitoxin AbrB/MazE fold protein